MTTIEFLRQFRLGGYAIFDFAVSFLGMALLSPLLSGIFLKFKIKIPKINWVFLTLPISIIFHIAFGKMTPLVQNFLNFKDHFILKIIVLIFLFLGLRNIEKIKK